jgi:ABC-type lipoprotein release transport system permease subunit
MSMILANLSRRKGRTILTVLGISIGVAAIVALGAVARGLEAGFVSMTRGSEADLVLSQAGTLSSLLSSVDEKVGDELRAWPEVADVAGVLFGNVLLDTGGRNFLVFGHDPEGFAVAHFRVIEGQELAAVRAARAGRSVRGTPLILGRRVAESLDKTVGDPLRLGGSAFRIVGIYETGDGLEDAAAVVPLQEAQALTLQSHRVSMFYIKLRNPADADRLRAKVERQYPDLTLSTSSGFVDQEQMLGILDGMAMGVAGLAVIIGGIVMANTLFMSVFERTREIGVLRSLGWRRRRVLLLILGESLVLSLLGGLFGTGVGVLSVLALNRSSAVLSMFGSQFTPGLFVRAMVTVVALGMVGGAYPAWWASRLLPVEALRYEGGGEARGSGLQFGGMTLRNLWRQRTRTMLTTLAIGVSITAVVALGGLAEGMVGIMTQMWRASQTDLFAIQADVDADVSAIDQQVGARIAARSDVEAVSGLIWTAVNAEDMPMLMVFGYHPRSYAIRHFTIIEGEPLTTRHQVIVGRQAAEQMGLRVGDTMRLLKSSFRVVGIYETGLGYEDTGVVISLREAQTLTGKSHQVMYYQIKLYDPKQAEAVLAELDAAFPGVDFSLVAESAQSMSDFRVMQEMVGQISFLAVFIGALGMLNAMVMSVMERTREIGVLRALGWRRRRVLGLIVQESLLLGAVGGAIGMAIGWGVGRVMPLLPGMLGSLRLSYSPELLVRAMLVALFAGALGGLYPAWRATRMRPVEALRYE